MILSIRNIGKSFGATVALRNVGLELRKGEVHALIGENGAGKSTLMNVLSGVLRPDSGAMEIGGADYSPSNPLDARRRGLALIHQELSLMPHLSVAENIMMGMEKSTLGWLDRDELRKRATDVLDYFEHSDLAPDTIVRDLPIASRQVVEICRAVAAKAGIVLMDEPTSSLHRDDIKRLFALIRRLRDDGVSIVYISHFLEEIREICDSYTVLRDGESVATGRIADVSDAELVAKMVGRPVDNLFPERPRTSGETILEVAGFTAPPAFRDINLTLRRGEILGIAGLLGSGRTAFVKALYGLVDATGGTVHKNGRELRAARPASRLADGFGYLSEDRKDEGLALSLSIADNLTLTNFGSCSRFGLLDRTRQTLDARRIVGEVGVKAGSTDEAVSTLSGGNQQKVAIGRLIHQDAEILLLDEPTRGIDIGSKAQVYETIARLAAEGKAILLVSSYLPELFGMCDRLAVMSNGRLSETRNIGEWTPESVMEEAIRI